MSLKSALISLITQPGYELRKYRVQRWWQRRGIRIEMAAHAKFSYDRCNFLDVPMDGSAIIMDVGANVGQSSVWFSESFPEATIYAFEPFAVICNRMKELVAGQKKVHCFQTAIGKTNGKIRVARIKDPYYQCGQILATAAESETEVVDVCRLDSFCDEHRIRQVHILKSDTEGFDLDVMRGAEVLLREGRISNILTEASIVMGDRQHTNLFELADYLRAFSFNLHAVYDLHHGRENGRLEYFNALFQLKK
jgi:FkbM family methyltransferase